MGHVLQYSQSQGDRVASKPAWDPTLNSSPSRSLTHLLTETDKAKKSPPPTRNIYIENFESPPPLKEWNFATTVEKKTKAQRETAKDTEQKRIQKTQQWYETARDQLPVKEPKSKESPENTSQKPELKGKLKQKDTTIKKYSHDGVWELSTLEGKQVWSCCLKTQKDAQGCKCTTKDPAKRNFASIN